MLNPRQFPPHVQVGIMRAVGKASDMMGTSPEAFKVTDVSPVEDSDTGPHYRVGIDQYLSPNESYQSRSHVFQIHEGDSPMSPIVRHTSQTDIYGKGSSASFNPEARAAKGFRDYYREGAWHVERLEPKD